MPLEKYISDLLYRYDLVIIPEFGGLIGRKTSARFNPQTYIFSPPHKELSFNNQLQKNDGLLANYIAEAKGITYNEALEFIQSEVKHWQNQLKEEKRLKLDQIGIFNLVSHDKLIFLPLTTKNYLAEAYGLISFVHKPVKALQSDMPVIKTGSKKINKPKQKTKATVKSVVKTYQKTPSTQSSKLWKYAAVFVLGLGIFTAGIKVIKQQNHVPQDMPYQKATFVLKQNFPAVQIGQKQDNVAKINQEKYFIISGAFRSKQNAVNNLETLKKQGFPAKIVGQTNHGLWLVAYQGFTSDEAAHIMLPQIKQTHSAAWVYRAE